jgi:AcrR family transcriptional regulator
MPVSSRKEREKERRRSQILEAAEVVFRRKGYQATTMDQVAEEAEFSKGTLYLYFGSKFALFSELSNRVLTAVRDEFENISEEPISGLQKVGQMLRFWASEMSSNIRRFRLAISWIASDDRHDLECPGMCSHRETMGTVIGILSVAIADGQSDGSVSNPASSTTLACQVWSGMVGALLFSSRVEQDGNRFPVAIDRENFMESFVDLLSSGLASKGIVE